MSVQRFASTLAMVAAGLLMPAAAGAAFDFDRQFGTGALQNPDALDLDGEGHVYVANVATGQVVEFDPTGEEIDRWGGLGTEDGRFTRIGGLAVDRTEGLLYLTDDQTGVGAQNRVQVFRTDGSFVRDWGQSGAGAGQFERPRGIAVAPGKKVALADLGNRRVQILDDVGTSVRAWGSFGYGDGPFFDNPNAIDFGPDGEVVVGDASGSIRVFSETGDFIRRFAGQELEPAQPGRFGATQGVTDLVVDGDGRTIALDRENHRVQVFATDGGFQYQFGTEGTGEGQFRQLTGIALSPDGTLYVADTDELGQGGRVQVFTDSPGTPEPNPSGPGAEGPEPDGRAGARFVIRKRIVNRRKASTTLVVSVPAAGVLRAAATKRTKGAVARTGKARRLRLVVRLKPGIRARLGRIRKVKVKVKVTFKPKDAPAHSRRVPVTIRL